MPPAGSLHFQCKKMQMRGAGEIIIIILKTMHFFLFCAIMMMNTQHTLGELTD